MKVIIMTGRLTADPEIKEVGDKNAKVANFTLANSDWDKDNAEFFDVACWDKTAEYVEKYMKKGNKVLVQGSFSNEKYQDKDGNNRHHFRITANTIEFAD